MGLGEDRRQWVGAGVVIGMETEGSELGAGGALDNAPD
jgi:hypothetical protein